MCRLKGGGDSHASTGSDRVASEFLGMGPIPVKTADIFTASSPFANPAAGRQKRIIHKRIVESSLSIESKIKSQSEM